MRILVIQFVNAKNVDHLCGIKKEKVNLQAEPQDQNFNYAVVMEK
jgi:hypothetical protein